MAGSRHRKIRVVLSTFVLAVLAFAMITYVMGVGSGEAGASRGTAAIVGPAGQSEVSWALVHERRDMLEALIEHGDHDGERRRATAEGGAWAHVGPGIVRVGMGEGPAWR